MQTPHFEKLGFSDLTEDEGLLVVTYRDWRSRGPTRAVAEHAIARLLRGDRFYPILDTIFLIFDTTRQLDNDDIKRDLLLSPAEEDLLTDVANYLQSADNVDWLSYNIRPTHQIPRSGQDRMICTHDKLHRDNGASNQKIH